MRTFHPRNPGHPASRPPRPGGWLRALSAAASIAIGTLAGPAATSALADSTGISGTVTDALSSQPAAAVQVNIFDSSGTLVSSTCTGSDGTYTFGGLSPQSYRVGFESTQGTFKVCGGRTNYLPAFYNAQPTLAAAQPVSVKPGATTNNINAALEPGGAIAGTVTDATNSAHLANIEVDAFDNAGSLVSATCTAADGSYSLFSLATGAYRVQFLNSASCGTANPYRTQFYNGQTTLAAAHPVNVSITQTTAGIDVALIPTSARTLTVTISGPGAVGFSPTGVSCNRSCILPVVGNKTITLTGTPASGYSLAGWSGAGCSGTFVCTVRMTGDQAVTVNFQPVQTDTGAPGSRAGGGPPASGAAARSACTLAVVSGRIRLTAPRPAASKQSGRSRGAAPAVKLRYRCPQASRLALRATFAVRRSTGAVHGRQPRRGTSTAMVAITPRSVLAGSGTFTVRLPALVVRALRSRLAVSGRFALRYSGSRGSGTAVAHVVRLRTSR